MAYLKHWPREVDKYILIALQRLMKRIFFDMKKTQNLSELTGNRQIKH